MQRKKDMYTKISCLFIGMAVIFVGCSSGAETTGNNTAAPGKETVKPVEVKADPVTLTAAIDAVIIDAGLEKLIVDELKKKHPNITLKILQPTKGSTLTDLLAAGTIPDIIFTYSGKQPSYADQNLLFDMTALAKQHQLDLGRFEANLLVDAKVASKKDELFGIPYGVNFHAMFYNKDIFDKFGAAYPTDGMTMDQTVELAKKVTRLDNGIQYRGLDPGSNISWIYQPLGIEAINNTTNKAAVNNDEWKQVFELVKRIYAIPGNAVPVPAVTPINQFVKDRTLAMIMYTNMFSQLEEPSKTGFNWNVAQYPSFPQKPNTYGNASVNVMMITSTSKNKDAAMQVIKVATSDEVQLPSSMEARMSPLTKPEIKQAFGKSVDYLKDKSLPSIFKSKSVKYPLSSAHRSKGEATLSKYFAEYNTGKIDVNTALRLSEEEINNMLEAESKK